MKLEPDHLRVQNETFADDIALVFENSNFVADLGIKLLACGVGSCASELVVTPRHLQHTGVVHAGVLATLLDNTAGAAAYTLMPRETNPVTLEFKLNLLRPASGERLECRASVLKAGKQFTVVESELYNLSGESSKLAAKASVTIVGLG